MKVTCTHENLYAALQALEPIVGKNISLPILENILIEAKEGVLFFSATNLEIGVIYETKAKIDEEGSIVVSIDLLNKLLRALQSHDNVSLETSATTLHITSGSYKTKISSYDAKDFPIIPQGTGKYIDVSLSGLQEHIRGVLDYVSHNEIRLELTGVFMHFTDKKIFSAATDSFRLGEMISQRQKIIIAHNDSFDVAKIILPPKLCSYINRLTVENDIVSVAIEDNHLFLIAGETRITARLLDGTYPDYTQIIPTQTQTNVILNKTALGESMRVMSIFTGKEMGEVHLEINDRGVHVSIQGKEIGEGDVDLEASVDGDAQRITLNPRYVLEGLKNITEEEIYIGVTSASAPVLFHGSTKDGINKNFTYIVMPVKSISN